MAKKAFILTAVLVAVLIIVCIIVAALNYKPVEFKSVVTYDSEINKMVAAPEYVARTAYTNNNDSLFSSFLKYEKTIMISSIVLVIIFLLFFYGTKRSKGW